MGLSSSKSTTRTNQQSSEQTSGTQMPVTPPYLEQAARDYVGRIAEFGNMDPNRFVAGASPLQQAAWANAGALDDWQGQAIAAARMAQQAGQSGANLGGRAALAAAPALGHAAQATASGYAAPTIAAAQGYAAPTLGQASSYAAARAGDPAQARAARIDPVTNAQAASLLDNFAAYQSPYRQQVVDASLAEYDQGVAEQQARLAAQGARTGAFGGSRFGIAEGQLAADAARGRATTAANLLDQGFRTAAELATTDAGFRQQAGLANAQAANQRSIAQAGLSQDAGLFNAGQANQFALDQAGRQDAAARAAADARNQFALTQAGLSADAARYGAEAANQRALAQAGLQADAAQYGAAARNQASLFNAGAQNDFASQQAQLAQQAALANQAAQNQMAQFNAGQRDAADARALQAAQLLGGLASDRGAGTRADLQTMAALGDQQRQIAQAYAMAPLAQLQAMGQLSGMTPYDILVGRQASGTSTGTVQGTDVTKSSPSLFNQLLAGASLFAPL